MSKFYLKNDSNLLILQHRSSSDDEKGRHRILFISWLIMCYISLVPIGKFKSEFKYKIHEESL